MKIVTSIQDLRASNTVVKAPCSICGTHGVKHFADPELGKVGAAALLCNPCAGAVAMADFALQQAGYSRPTV